MPSFMKNPILCLVTCFLSGWVSVGFIFAFSIISISFMIFWHSSSRCWRVSITFAVKGRSCFVFKYSLHKSLNSVLVTSNSWFNSLVKLVRSLLSFSSCQKLLAEYKACMTHSGPTAKGRAGPEAENWLCSDGLDL